jgi:hypothetical protein
VQYATARNATGERVWILSLIDGRDTPTSCYAFERRGRINSSLEIPSVPALADPGAFWSGVMELCRRETLSMLEVNTYASPETNIPRLPGLVAHELRREFVIDLKEHSDKTIASKHHRNIDRAREAGLSVRRVKNPQACATHAKMIGASMQRRSARGEHVSTDVDETPFHSYVEYDAGEVLQALQGDDEVLASVLVLRATAGAYLQSAGTSEQGMNCGASPFLIYETTQLLRREGAVVFNLGGAGDDNPGLQRFKRRFGAREVPLERAEFFVGGALRRRLGTAAAFVGDRVATLRARYG